MNLRMMEIDASNAALLSNFLYEAIFVPSGMQPPSRDILADPQLQVYVHDFGKQTGDFGLFAEVEGCNCRRCMGTHHGGLRAYR